jgi:hypothetical protein
VLIRRAEALDDREYRSLHSEMYGSSNDCSDDKMPEHRAIRDLHVVAELRVKSLMNRNAYFMVRGTAERSARNLKVGHAL